MWLHLEVKGIPKTPKMVPIASRLVLIILGLTLRLDLEGYDHSVITYHNTPAPRRSQTWRTNFTSIWSQDQSVGLKPICNIRWASRDMNGIFTVLWMIWRVHTTASDSIAPLYYCAVLFSCKLQFGRQAVPSLELVGFSQPVSFALTQFQQRGVASKQTGRKRRCTCSSMKQPCQEQENNLPQWFPTCIVVTLLVEKFVLSWADLAHFLYLAPLRIKAGFSKHEGKTSHVRTPHETGTHIKLEPT